MNKTFTDALSFRKLAAASLSLTLIAASCSDDPDSNSSDATTRSATATTSIDTSPDSGSTKPASLDGTWQFVGAGYFAEVSDSEVTQIYMPVGEWCTTTSEGAGIEVLENGSEVTAAFPGSISSWKLERIELPEACESPDGDATPQETVEAFIGVMDERYPFFAERSVDWEDKKVELRTSAEGLATTAEAAQLLASFIEELGDGHTFIESADGPSAKDQAEFEQALQLASSEAEKVTALLGDSMEGGVEDPMFWGNIDPNIGYIAINQMGGYSSQGEQATPAEDVEAFAELLDQALRDLEGSDQLIIDVRFNGGGHDAVSLEAVSRFIDESTDVFSKEQYSAPETKVVISVDPTERVSFDGEVVVLVSEYTASAAEIFGASMREAAGAKIAGLQTQGIFSDINPWVLPGGVDIGYSAEVYRDLDGETYEVRGVPIDIQAPIEGAVDTAIKTIR